MSLRDLLPGSEQLTHAEGVERELLRRRRNGALTGYGGGIERKRWLLSHERACAGGRRQSA